MWRKMIKRAFQWVPTQRKATNMPNTEEVANVYIFNQIVGNENCVKRLCATFEDMGCSLECHQHIISKEFHKIADRIVSAKFSCWNYVVIIILDNGNSNHRKMYVDGKQVKYGYLTTRLQSNRTLGNKKLVIILQNNNLSDDSDSDDENDNKNKVSAEFETPLNPQTNSITSLYDMDIIEISAAGLCQKLDAEHWKSPIAEVSSFVKIFCEHFPVAETKPMSEIIGNIRKDYNTENLTLKDGRNVPKNFILGPARKQQ